MSTEPVELGRSAPSVVAAPRRRARAVERALGAYRLSRFFGGLVVKEHLAPGLHVRPLVAELFVTENCNLRCVSCACWTTTTRAELTTEEWRNVIDQLADLHIVKVNFTGGEPLLRRDLAELMNHAVRRGVGGIHLNTNAILLDSRRRAQVLSAGARSFNVSVDGSSAPTHDAVRGRDGAFSTTVRNLQGLLAERERFGLKVRMNFTVLDDNVDDLAAIAQLAQELKVRLYLNLGTDSTFLFRTASVTPRVMVDDARLRRALGGLERVARRDTSFLPRFSDLNYIRHHFGERVQRSVPCAESQLKLMVHSTGGVGGCWGHDPVMNVRDMPIADIIDHPHYRGEHTRFFAKDCVGCGSNYSLNLRWRPSTYIADRQWARGRRSLSS